MMAAGIRYVAWKRSQNTFGWSDQEWAVYQDRDSMKKTTSHSKSGHLEKINLQPCFPFASNGKIPLIPGSQN
jgi:hypothetical protein